jgi:hypothetical protein
MMVGTAVSARCLDTVLNFRVLEYYTSQMVGLGATNCSPTITGEELDVDEAGLACHPGRRPERHDGGSIILNKSVTVLHSVGWTHLIPVSCQMRAMR